MLYEKGVTNVCAKMGRPKSENPKSTSLTLRLDNETLNKLDTIAEINSVTRVEALRQGVDFLYKYIKK